MTYLSTLPPPPQFYVYTILHVLLKRFKNLSILLLKDLTRPSSVPSNVSTILWTYHRIFYWFLYFNCSCKILIHSCTRFCVSLPPETSGWRVISRQGLVLFFTPFLSLTLISRASQYYNTTHLCYKIYFISHKYTFLIKFENC